MRTARSASVYVEEPLNIRDPPPRRAGGPTAQALYDNLAPSVSPRIALCHTSRTHCLERVSESPNMLCEGQTFQPDIMNPPHSHPKDDSELQFKQGDVLDILEQIDDNWLLCVVNGHTGHVPINYVNIVA